MNPKPPTSVDQTSGRTCFFEIRAAAEKSLHLPLCLDMVGMKVSNVEKGEAKVGNMLSEPEPIKKQIILNSGCETKGGKGKTKQNIDVLSLPATSHLCF